MTPPTCPQGKRFGFDYYDTEHNQTCPHAVNMNCLVVSECRELNLSIDRLPTVRKGLNRIYRQWLDLSRDMEYFTFLHGDIRAHRKGRAILQGMEDLINLPGGDRACGDQHEPLIRPPGVKPYRVYFRDTDMRVHHRIVKAKGPTEAMRLVYDRYVRGQTVPHPEHPDWYSLRFHYPHRAEIEY